MPNACEDMRDRLLSDPDVARLVADRVYVDVVPAGGDLPFVWVHRRGVGFLDILGEVEPDPFRELLDVECVTAAALEQIELTDAARACLDGARGQIGEGVYSWVAVRDQADDYLVRNQADEHLFVGSLDVEIFKP